MLLVHLTNIENLETILLSGQILSYCENNIDSIKDEYCPSISEDDLYNSRKKKMSQNLAFIAPILDVQNMDIHYEELEDVFILLDPKMLSHQKKRHIHMSAGWKHGKADNAIIYNKYMTPKKNLKIYKNFLLNNFSESSDFIHSIFVGEIVSTKFDVKNYILGICYNENHIKNINHINILKDLEKKYSNLAWFSSLKKFKDTILEEN